MPVDFPSLFGDALAKFLAENGITEAEAARRMDIGRATLNTYTRVSGRCLPNAEVLAKACTALGFQLEYDGKKIVATKEEAELPALPKQDQLGLPFDEEFDLSDGERTISVSLRRPPGRIEVSLSLKAAS